MRKKYAKSDLEIILVKKLLKEKLS